MSARKQPWLRWYTDVLHNPKVHRLGKPEYWTWTMMLAAFRANDDVMPPLADLAFLLRMPEKTLAKHIETITAVGLFDRTEDGIRPHNWDDRQFLSDTSRERTRAYRERHKQQPNSVTSDGDVTSHARHAERHSDGVVTAQESDTESDTESESEPPVVPRRGTKPVSVPPEFDRFRQVYPDRSGDQNWRRALHACHARLAEGHTWDDILDGAERYARFIEATGKLGTEYVKQAATFCGPDKAFLNPWIPPPSKAEARTVTNLAGITEWLNGSHS